MKRGEEQLSSLMKLCLLNSISRQLLLQRLDGIFQRTHHDCSCLVGSTAPDCEVMTNYFCRRRNGYETNFVHSACVLYVLYQYCTAMHRESAQEKNPSSGTGN